MSTHILLAVIQLERELFDLHYKHPDQAVSDPEFYRRKNAIKALKELAEDKP